MKVLFTGNSYTYYIDMPQMFENVAKDDDLWPGKRI